MGINLEELDQAGIKEWGPTITLSLTVELNKLSKLSAVEWNNANLTNLKRLITNFEELQTRAKQINVSIYGVKLKAL